MHPTDPTPNEHADLAPPPSLLRRLGALLYDALLLLGLAMLAVFLFIFSYHAFTGRPYPHEDLVYRTLMQAYLLAVIAGFFLYFWTHGGQTLGMYVWRFRLVREDGGPVTGADGLRRLAWATLSLVPAGLGLWWCLFDRDRLAWHDRLSHTRLVSVVPYRKRP